MYIRVDVLVGFYTGGAFAASIFFLFILAYQVLGKCEAKGKATCAFRRQ